MAPLWPVIFLTCVGMLLAGCDSRKPPVQPKKATPTVSDSALDDLLRKPPPPPPLPPRLVAEPQSLTFPSQKFGQTAEATIRLSNQGGAPTSLGPLRLAGQSADFSLAGDCRDGTALAPAASCGVTIRFRPQQANASVGELVVDQGIAGSSLFVPLRGDALIDVGQPPAGAGAKDAEYSLRFAASRQTAAFALSETTIGTGERPRGLDYVDAGLPGVVSSYPVDRRRVLTADRYITAVLETTLNSQLPGRAVAVVERPVFGEDDRYVLIPAGSRIIGNYRQIAKYGESRLDIAWTRILRPDGGTINIADTATDAMGRAGVPGDLDNRLPEKYGSSLLVSVIGAAATWALANSSTAVTSPIGGTTQVESGRTLAANRLGNDTDRLAQRLVEDSVDIRPVLTLPQGTRLVIVPTEDIWLRDPDHLRPVSPPKGASAAAKALPTATLLKLLPALVDFVAQSPTVQRTAPGAAQELLQSSLMQQWRDSLQANPPKEDAVAADGSQP